RFFLLAGNRGQSRFSARRIVVPSDAVRRRKTGSDPLLWAALHLPQRSLDAAVRRQADPRAPLVLATGPAQRRVVALANAGARAAGVQPGQPLAAAQALCPQAVVLPLDEDEATRLLGLVAAWAYRW